MANFVLSHGVPAKLALYKKIFHMWLTAAKLQSHYVPIIFCTDDKCVKIHCVLREQDCFSLKLFELQNAIQRYWNKHNIYYL